MSPKQTNVSNPAWQNEADIDLSHEDEEEKTFEFPPMTETEKQIMIDWTDSGQLTLISLIKILNTFMINAEGFSFWDKMQNLNLTKINNTLNENVFAKIITVNYCRSIDIHEHKTQNIHRHTNKLVELWREFVDNYTPSESYEI